MKIQVLLDMTRRRLVNIYHRVGVECCLYLQSPKSKSSKGMDFLDLNLEAFSSSETSAMIYQRTRRRI